ncbi:MAG: hypothetical protein HGA96_08700 [Desulfobulbaceae bacterium]|nr:hypothetical protein [Desulfobulbaceae bacterium]
MSRKFPIQKRQVAGFGGYAGMITAYPIRQAPLAPARRRRPVSRRVAKAEHWTAQPLTFLAGLLLAVAVVGVGFLSWQVQQRGSALAQEKFEQDGLSRTNRELSGKREQLLVRDNITRRAAVLGLYPARPDQLRTIGG